MDPLADARVRLGASAVLELSSDPPDLDGDGTPDVIVHSPGGRESTHLLYAGTCARFVGRVEAAMLGCQRDPGHWCELWVDTWLMHGDRSRSRWSFDGTSYRQVGEGELVPGPQRHP